MDGKTYAALIVCFVEATVLGGAFFGWTSLVYVLQEDGLYSHLCHHDNSSTPNTHQMETLQTLIHDRNETPSYTLAPVIFTDFFVNRTEDSPRIHAVRCTKQKVQLALSFTVGIVSYGIGALPIGLFFDRFGLRTTRTLAVIVGVVAYIQLAFASQGTEWLIMTGACCVGLSCYTLVMTSCQVALLAGLKSSTITAVYMGGIDTSFAYQAVKLLQANGIPRFYSLIFIGCIWFLVLFSSWFLLPSFKVKAAAPSDKSMVTVEKEKSPEKGKTLPDSTVSALKIENPLFHDVVTSPSVTLRHLLLSVTFVLFVFWFCSLIVRINMLTNGYDLWMTSLVKGDITKVSYFTDVMAYGTLLGTLPSPIVGIITDCMRSRFGSQPGGTYFAMIPAVTLTSILGIALTIPLFFSNEINIYFTVILFAIVKSFIFSTHGNYIAIVCPPQYFGLLFGITYMISGVGNFMMYPYFMWVEAARSFTPVNILILVTLVLALSLPVKLYHNRRQHCKSHQDKHRGKDLL